MSVLARSQRRLDDLDLHEPVAELIERDAGRELRSVHGRLDMLHR